MNWNNLVVRALSGFVFAAVMLGSIYFSKWAFLAVALLILCGSIVEFYRLTDAVRDDDSQYAQRNWVIGVSVVALLLSFFANQRYIFLDTGLLLPLAAFILFAVELRSHSKHPFSNIGWNTTALLYLLLPLMFTFKIFFEKGGLFLIALFCIIWFYDSACYVFGSLFGKHKLTERISPKKTIEGLLAGAALTLVLAWFITLIPGMDTLQRVEWVVLSAVIIVSGTIGDLFESLLKRSLGVKDSGNIMPGHGGFLDRFDAYFFAVPFVVMCLWMMEQIQVLLMMLRYING